MKKSQEVVRSKRSHRASFSIIAAAPLACVLLVGGVYGVLSMSGTLSARAVVPSIKRTFVDTSTPTSTPTTATPSPTVTTTPTSTPSPTTTPTSTVTATPTPSPTLTPSPSPSPSPSPTSTATSTPSPTASATGAPSPTGTPKPVATAQPSPGATGAVQTPTPGITATQGTGVGPTPGGATPPAQNATSAPAQSDTSNSQPGGLPMTMLVVSLAGITVIGGALIAAFLIVRRKLLLPALPNLPPSGAAPWRRERSGDGMDRDSYAPPASAAMPAAPITEPIYFQPQAFPAYVQQRVSSPASPVSAPLGDYTGLANQGFTPQAQGFPSPQSAPVEASPAPHLQQQGIRPRLRRNSLLHGTNSQPSLPSLSLDTGDGLSADSGALSDPHVQAMIRQYSQKGQAVRQSGQQPPDAPFPGV